jgi:hypothetical protein
VRIERNETGRRSPWPPFRRRRDLELTLPLRTIDDLFTAPDLDPFSHDYETYGEKPGIEAIAGVLHAEQGVRQVETTVELPPGAIDSELERRVTEAIDRYCRVKIAELDLELLRIKRYGVRALLIGLVAVLALNALSRPLDRSDNPVLELVSQGLQIAAWVTLWFPINVLVYDRWYSRRDQRVYTQMLLMDVSVAPNPSLRPEPAGRSTGR